MKYGCWPWAWHKLNESLFGRFVFPYILASGVAEMIIATKWTNKLERSFFSLFIKVRMGRGSQWNFFCVFFFVMKCLFFCCYHDRMMERLSLCIQLRCFYMLVRSSRVVCVCASEWKSERQPTTASQFVFLYIYVIHRTITYTERIWSFDLNGFLSNRFNFDSVEFQSHSLH